MFAKKVRSFGRPYNPCHGDPCSLCWPADRNANCDAPPGRFANITLRNITIRKPKASICTPYYPHLAV